jgi:3-methyladenine DNA glycosylase AlkD
VSNDYARLVRDELAAHADPEQAGPMRAYMKDHFPFFGVKTPRRRDLVRSLIADHGLPEISDLRAVCEALWAEPERECHYAAIDLMERSKKRLTVADIAWIEPLIVANTWWDSVDALSSPTIADLLKRDRAARDKWISRWRVSENFWLRRVTLIFQRRYKTETDAGLLFALIRENLESKEFFIQKAIGWALREYAYFDPAAVASFVATTKLAPLSRREALKHLGATPSSESGDADA